MINSQGIIKNTRYLPCKTNFLYKYDINRYYGKLSLNNIHNNIIKIISDADFILDFHEGYDYHIVNPNSIGSTISTSKRSGITLNIANLIQKNLNKTIKNKKKHFLVRTYEENIKYSLRHYCQNNNLNYNLIEITGQNNIQPINLRIKQTINVLETVFKYYKII